MELPTKAIWKKLSLHHNSIKSLNIKDQFVSDPQRASKFTLEAASLLLDYSKNKISEETINLLCKLAEESKLQDKIEAMFEGEKINITEDRAVLHTALRNPNFKAKVLVDGKSVMPEIQEVLANMSACVEAIRNGSWKGHTHKRITDVVNIGIGGSDLGPYMVTEALTPYASSTLQCHFISNVDATHISETLKYLDPETTVFIIASKTFTTQETLCNAVTAKEWLLSQSTADKSNDIIKHHFLAVTAKPERAVQFGILAKNIFPFWDWVGGRYSLWSAIGLSIALAIGMENFKKLLQGAHVMDEHFRETELSKNMPVILALLGIWNTDFLEMATQAIIPYDQYLHLLPSYLQQLDMESNGKRVTVDGKEVTYKTAPVLWGAVGTNGQHAFHQLLMQGTQIVPIDFIVEAQSHNPVGDHHLLLYANCLAQSQALMCGRTEEDVIAELVADGMALDKAKKIAPHKVIPGNVPTNTIFMQKLTPETLGALLALYEHKVFVQGVIWQINSFDQWGVELGKKLANNVTAKLQDKKNTDLNLDSSTGNLIKYYQKYSTRTE